MKIYVKGEMPTHIGQRVIHCEDGDLCGIELLFNSSSIDMQKENSVHPVAEREAEVRKEVVGEIRKLAQTFISSKDFSLCNHEYANGLCYGLQYELSKILNQVEKENSDVKD